MAKNNVVKIEEGKEKIQNILITFDEYDYDNPANELKFKTEELKDIAGYQVNGDLIGVTKKDGGNVVIPMRRVYKIETSFVNKD